MDEWSGMASVPQEHGLLVLPAQGTQIQSVLCSPPPCSPLTSGLIVIKIDASILKPGACLPVLSASFFPLWFCRGWCGL